MESARKVPPDELRRMLAEVCAQTQVRIDADDPAVAIAVLNRLALQSALERGVAEINAATADLREQIDVLQIRAGAIIAQELRRSTQGSNVAARPEPRSPEPQLDRKVLLAVVPLITFGLGVGFGILVG